MKTKVSKAGIAFWDTSAIVPLCCRQDASQPLRQWWRQLDRVVVWWGTSVEIRGALSRLLREGAITPRDSQPALKRLETLRKQWREIMPGDRVRDLAETLPDTYGLRAMDSLQLAAALVWCGNQPKGRLLICIDNRLTEAAQKAGFTVHP
ncbi:MAG: type II toxin-antitoxin system VapC family toxin [Blastocatellia bacterium]